MAILSSVTVDLLALVAVLSLVLYMFLRSRKQYWIRRGVPQLQPSVIFGNFKESCLGRRIFIDDITDAYNKMPGHKYCGIYQVQEPVLLVRDPELAKVVLTKDFNSFASRGQPFDEENDPLSAHLFNLDGARWKSLRAKLSPTFTSGKLKLMFPLMKECVEELVAHMRERMNDGDLDMKDLITRYTTDLIGTCAFGITCNSIKNPDAEFYEMSRAIFKPTLLFQFRFALQSISPWLANKLMPFWLLFPKTTTFFINLMKETVEYRTTNNVVRNDFVNLMMEIRKAERERPEEVSDDIRFTDNVMTAQAFLFFVAGLDNVSNSVGFSLYEMALNPDVQNKLAAEVRRVLAKHNGVLSYESIKEMDYLGWTLEEAARKYTPVGALFRQVTVPKYDLPDSDVTLHAGEKVLVATGGMMNDPAYFPDPQRFDPERFSEETKSTRHPYTYLPFGEGPRFCIAERFAKLEMKVALAALVNEFEFHVGPTTQVPIQLSKKTFSPMPTNGFPLKITVRK